VYILEFGLFDGVLTGFAGKRDHFEDDGWFGQSEKKICSRSAQIQEMRTQTQFSGTIY